MARKAVCAVLEITYRAATPSGCWWTVFMQQWSIGFCVKKQAVSSDCTGWHYDRSLTKIKKLTRKGLLKCRSAVPENLTSSQENRVSYGHSNPFVSAERGRWGIKDISKTLPWPDRGKYFPWKKTWKMVAFIPVKRLSSGNQFIKAYYTILFLSMILRLKV